MNIKTINLEAERGSKKELCMKKIVHTVEMLQRVDEEKRQSGPRCAVTWNAVMTSDI